MNVTGTVDKEYPTHSGLKRSSSRCVKEIIQMYPKQLHTKVRAKFVSATTLLRPNIDLTAPAPAPRHGRVDGVLAHEVHLEVAVKVRPLVT